MPSWYQRVRDPIHNIISFEDTVLERTLWSIVQTPEFQRLRRIKQLGFTEFVFPGETHTRFAHSLGVFHLTKKLLSLIKDKYPSYYNSTRADQTLAAAILHDIGHCAFSHAFESVFKNINSFFPNHESISAEIIKNSNVSQVLLSIGGASFSEDVAKQISSGEVFDDIYSAVVSSQFDADRLDYMQRDRLMTGTQTGGSLDVPWLLSNLEIEKISYGSDDIKISNKETFVLNPKARFAAESYILGLFQLYPTVYYHKATRGIEKIFIELITRVFSVVQDGGCSRISLPKNHPLFKLAQSTGQEDALEALKQIDDTVVFGALSLLAESHDPFVSEFSYRLHNRKIYKCYDVLENIDMNASDLEIKRIEDKIKEKITDWKNAHPDKILRILEDSAEREPYKRVLPDESPFHKIIIKNKDQNIDLAEYSSVISSLKKFRLYRLYYDKEDKDAERFINSIEGICNAKSVGR